MGARRLRYLAWGKRCVEPVPWWDGRASVTVTYLPGWIDCVVYPHLERYCEPEGYIPFYDEMRGAWRRGLGQEEWA